MVVDEREWASGLLRGKNVLVRDLFWAPLDTINHNITD